MKNIYSEVRTTVQPVSEFITLEQAKLHLRVDLAEDDNLITSLIKVAREKTEKYTNTAIGTQTKVLRMGYFPRGSEGIRLPRGPIQSVTSVEYIDLNGDLLAFSDYNVDLYGAVVYPIFNTYFPLTRLTKGSNVIVTYVTGYTVSDIPESFIHAMKLLITHLYDNRSATTLEVKDVLPLGYEYLLHDYILRNDSMVYFT